MEGAHGGSVCNSIVILGPTACGKTALAVRCAAAVGGEILSADSRQVYCGLDIGSGKDLNEYRLKDASGCLREIPYHLIDICSLSREYSVFDYQKDFYTVFASVLERGSIPVICGGTGMYLDAVIRGYDLVQVPVNSELRQKLSGASLDELSIYLRSLKTDLHNHTDLTERHRLLRAIEIETFVQSGEAEILRAEMPPRPDFKPLVFNALYPRSVLRDRITKRLRDRFKAGMIDEVDSLHNDGVSWARLERLGLEYRYIAEYLQGKIKTQDELFALLNTAIGRFAKRQETWFRGMEKKGVKIEKIPLSVLQNPDESERFNSFLNFARTVAGSPFLFDSSASL